MNFAYKLSPQDAMNRENTIQELKLNPYVSRFLKENHLPDSFLEQNASLFKDSVERQKQCENCTGLEFCTQRIPGRIKELYVDEMGFLNDRYVMCPKAAKKASLETHKKSYRINHMSDEELQVRLSSLQAAKEESKEYALAYKEALKSGKSPKGIFLFGEPGTGKTYMLSAFANEAAIKGQDVSFVKVPQLIQDLKMNLKDDQYKTKTMRALQQSSILFLDDIGAEMATPWIRDEILFPLLDYRMTHHMKTYFTSNFAPDNLSIRYILSQKPEEKVASMRIMERIMTLANPVMLSGHSRRR